MKRDRWTQEEISDLGIILEKGKSWQEVRKWIKGRFNGKRGWGSVRTKIRRTPELKKLVERFPLKDRIMTTNGGRDVVPSMAKTNHILSELERRVVEILKKGLSTLPGLSHELELSQESVVRLLGELREKGYDVFENRRTKQVSLSRDAFSLDPLEIKPLTYRRNSIKFAVISDTRMGGTSSQVSLLHDAYKDLEERQVDFVIHAGNVVAGDRSAARKDELFLATPESQKQFVVDHYPRAPFRTYMVAGQLDLTWKKKKGYNVVRGICKTRDDLVYRGDDAALFEAKGNLIYVAHPGNDDTPYAKSYKLQKIAENHVGYLRSIGKHAKAIPQIAFMGGWHVEDQLFGHYAHGAYSLPSFISQNKQLAKKHIAPAIGYLVIEIFFDDEGNIRDVKPEYVTLSKYQVDRDYLNIPSSHDLENGCELSREEREILELVKWVPLSPGELSRRLNKPKKKVLEFVEHLKQCGYEITIPEDTDQVTLSIGLKDSYHSTGAYKRFGKKFKFGAISDTHSGSKHQQPGLWDKAYEVFSEEDVDFVAHGGDVTDGGGGTGYRGHAKDVFIWEVDEQKTQMVDRYPRAKKRKEPREVTLLFFNEEKKTHEIITLVISGNHDDWDMSALGYDIVEQICREREDLIYLGRLSGRFECNGVRFKVLHPAGGQGYAKSYKPQRLIEGDISKHILALEGEDGDVDILLLGNWHHYHFIHYMGTYSFTLPCLKTTDDFHETRGLTPFLGVVVVEITLDKDGDIIAISPKFVNLAPFAKERDY